MPLVYRHDCRVGHSGDPVEVTEQLTIRGCRAYRKEGVSSVAEGETEDIYHKGSLVRMTLAFLNLSHRRGEVELVREIGKQ